MAIEIEFLEHQERLFFNDCPVKGLYCGRGSGKSFWMQNSSALDLAQGLRCLYFCQTNAVMEGNFIPEIKDTLERWGFHPKVNEKKHTIRIEESDGVIFYYSYENYENARGATKIRNIYFDEIALAPSPSLLFSAVAPCMRDSGGKTGIRFASTPKKGSEWDKWVKSELPKKYVIWDVTMDDNPKASEEEKQLIKSLINDPNFYRQEILGEILDDELDFCVIREYEFPKLEKARLGFVSLGIDCAGDGRDNFEFVCSDDSGMIDKVETNEADVLKQMSIVRMLVNKYDVKQIVIDTTGGFGNGLRDLCKTAFPNIDVVGVNFGQSAIDNKNYANARAEMYFVIADAIRAGFYVGDEKAKEELRHTTFNVNNSGKTILDPKEQIKTLLGRSPDTSDALCLSVYLRNQVNNMVDAREVANAFLRAFGH